MTDLRVEAVLLQSLHADLRVELRSLVIPDKQNQIGTCHCHPAAAMKNAPIAWNTEMIQEGLTKQSQEDWEQILEKIDEFKTTYFPPMQTLTERKNG